jgi:hypothetical protein
MRNGRRFRIPASVPRLSAVPVCYGCKACDRGEADRAVGGRFQRPTRRGSSQALAKGSAQGGRRDRCEHGGAATAQTGSGVVCARSRSRRVLPQLTRGHREPVPPPAYCGAQWALPRAAGALLPVRLLAAAAELAAGGVRTLPGLRLRGSVFLHVPRGAILLPVMAGGARRGNNAVYVGAFCGSEEEGCRAPFQVALRPGTGRSKIRVNPTYVWTGRGPHIQLLPYSGPR